MTQQGSKWFPEAVAGWSAYRGYKAYQATGDKRVGVGTGMRTYGNVWVLCQGIGWTLLFGVLGIFWAPFLVALVVTVPLIFLGIHLLGKGNRDYKALTSGAQHRMPPPIPPGAALPSTGPSTPTECTYGYDLNTGRFTKVPRIPELPRG
jgi:hypothetical protein